MCGLHGEDGTPMRNPLRAGRIPPRNSSRRRPPTQAELPRVHGFAQDRRQSPMRNNGGRARLSLSLPQLLLGRPRNLRAGRTEGCVAIDLWPWNYALRRDIVAHLRDRRHERDMRGVRCGGDGSTTGDPEVGDRLLWNGCAADAVGPSSRELIAADKWAPHSRDPWRARWEFGLRVRNGLLGQK
jgi:hypothetical protein